MIGGQADAGRGFGLFLARRTAHDLAGVTNTDITSGTAVGTKEIAFVYDNYDPAQTAISVGGTVLSKGVYYVQNGAVFNKSLQFSQIIADIYL